MAKKKSKHGGARQGAGSLPRLDKVGNVLRLSPVVVIWDDKQAPADPVFEVVEKGRGYAILKDRAGAMFKLEIVKED